MRGIALKIFLSFWITFAILIASFAILPDRVSGVVLTNQVRRDGLIAAQLLEEEGAASCAAFSAAIEKQTRIRFALVDRTSAAVCQSPSAKAEPFGADVATQGAKGKLSNSLAIVSVESPSGMTFTSIGASPNGLPPPVSPPAPYEPVALAILVSGVICFLVARYLARPLHHMRDVAHQLAQGDLHARVGPRIGTRRDEIGDLVRDFDAMAARIEALIHSQRQLLSDISHELRSPLARLQVALELARRKTGGGASELARIETEANRMDELIGRALTLARAESDEVVRDAVPIDLEEVIRRVTDNAAYEAQQQQKKVLVRVTSGAMVTGDAQLIASALDNVVRNGVRYTPGQSAVELDLDSNKGEAIITVRDHGPGVPPSELERIFSPFHRVEPARNRASGEVGVGLGLAITQRAIAVHRGSVTAENADGGGLRVIIRLPLYRAAEGS